MMIPLAVSGPSKCDDGFVSDAMADDDMSFCSSIGLAACPSPARNYLELRSLYQTPVESDVEGSIAGSRCSVNFPARKEFLVNGNNTCFYHRANAAKAQMLTKGCSLNASRDDDFEDFSDFGSRSSSMPRSVVSVPACLSAAAAELEDDAVSSNGDVLDESDDIIGVLTRTLKRAEKNGLIITSKSLPCSPPLRVKHMNQQRRVSPLAAPNGSIYNGKIGIKRTSNVVVDDDSLMVITPADEDVENKVPHPPIEANTALTLPVPVTIPKPTKEAELPRPPSPAKNGQERVSRVHKQTEEKAVAFHRRNSKSLERPQSSDQPSTAHRRSRSTNRQDSISSVRPAKNIKRQDSDQSVDKTVTNGASNNQEPLESCIIPPSDASSSLPPKPVTLENNAMLPPKANGGQTHRLLPLCAKKISGSGGMRKRVARETNEILNSGGIGLHHTIKKPHDLVIQLFESALCLVCISSHFVFNFWHSPLI